MVTRMLRRGLPRVPGGEPWPPADAAVELPGAPATASGVDTPDVGRNAESIPRSGVSTPEAERADAGVGAAAEAVAGAAGTAAVGADGPDVAGAGAWSAGLRRGLPREPGGEPWPPAGTRAGDAAPPVGQTDAQTSIAAAAPVSPGAASVASGADTPDVGRNPESIPRSGVSAPSAAPRSGAPAPEAAADDDGIPIRRGLPRTAGGDPWPPAGTVARGRATVAEIDEAAYEGPDSPVLLAEEGAASASAVVAPATDLAPIPTRRTVWHGQAPRHVPAVPASARPRPTWPQAIAGLFAAAGLGVLAAAVVAFVRTLLSLPFMQDFLAAFPGEYEPAIHVAPGFAPWVGWQHFFNMFLMVLIIRSGLTIRREKRPTAFWTPRNNPKGKVSLTIWFHQALDILWLTNGVIFLVLLFATGHWVRIVPTSWEVLPNALSAALQYVSFDWPAENGWNNYNSLQQLAYFVTVFLAAPLAAVTGFRMSGLWPKRAERLSKAYPIEWARKVHFPVMLYFVLFIIAHVALVFLTGMLANLNHMFASSDAVTWTGFWVFVVAIAVIAAGWAAARPLVIAPIAKLFGNVSGR
ncbi:cytochrome b/b6 domain-containing protein [Microbacterium hydrocarbonoxydans]|uniref:cytochrome b/b6 domain-containing protein n=1 Tax=Microbacterium hydrocarbonoxydans TaxID=273678 RepID=UPI003D958313